MSKFTRAILPTIIFIPVLLLLATSLIAVGIRESDNYNIALGLIMALVVTPILIVDVARRVLQSKTDPEDTEQWVDHITSARAKYAPWTLNPLVVDANSYKLIKSQPRIFMWVPLATTISIIAAAILFGTVFFVWEPQSLGLVLLGMFTASFVSVSLFFAGFMLSAEILQRQLMVSRRSLFKELPLNYWRALPLLVVMSVMLVIFLLLSDDDDQSSLPNFSSWEDYLSVAALIVFKYYIYLNLAAIAFNEPGSRVKYKTTSALLKREKLVLFKLWTSSGPVFAVFWLVFGSLAMITNGDIYWILSLLSLVLAILVTSISEQIHVLLHYVRIKHPELRERLEAVAGTPPI